MLFYLKLIEQFLQLLSMLVEAANSHVTYLEQLEHNLIDVLVDQTIRLSIVISAFALRQPGLLI